MVLLKNDGVLPLDRTRYKTIAVIGPNAASLSALEGNYNGVPRDPLMPVDAVRAAFPNAHILYSQGAPYVEGIVLPVPRSLFRPAAGSAEEGLKAEYFASTSMQGKPVISRVDPQIDFDWTSVSPLPGNSTGGFGVRWTGVLVPPAPGKYEFNLRVGRCRLCGGDDHFAVTIDGKEVAAARNSPPASGMGSAVINGTTGMPQDPRVTAPPRFTLEFADLHPHPITIEMTRSSSLLGGGISLDWQPPTEVLLKQAVEAARNADLVVAMVGLSPQLEGEEMPVHVEGFSGGDRTDIKLPQPQQNLLEQLAATGKPMVTVLLNGSALAVNWAQEHSNAILEAWYPGEAGGKAIADTLTGQNNPGGRLPVTFYQSVNDLPPFTDYSMSNRTYRYFKGKALYDFGYGLSYTSFSYSHLKLSTQTVHAGDTLTLEADVRNTGKVAGDEVAELYLAPPKDSNGGISPKLRLEGFQRIHLAPGQVEHVTLKLAPRQLSEVDADGIRAVLPGSYAVSLGGSQPGDARTSDSVQSATFSIIGRQELPH
jgi:beta-glucosidase